MGTGRRPARRSGRRADARPAPETARALALAVIRRVTEERAYSTIALSSALERTSLSPRDRVLAADLVYGTLRRLLILDRALARESSRPIRAIDAEALALLRLGAYQLLFTRIPDHAAVSETVNLASPRHRGFVNAILRRVAAGPPEPPTGEDDRAVSARTGLVPWAVAELRRLLPAEEVEPAASALAHQAELSLRANRCVSTPEALASRLQEGGHEVEPGRHHPDALRVKSANPAGLPGYREGWFAVQDESSVLVGAAVEASAGERILDACAGPGGKAAHLACRVGPEGLLVAADVRPARARLVAAAARRLHAPLVVLVQDASRPAVGGRFDAVLVDAPCSGLGAARRRPELLWRPARENLSSLARLQVDILAGSAGLVRPGGRLVYSVCTFPRAETDAAVRAFLSKHIEFEPMDVPGPGGSAPSHRLWPHRHGTDAMFYAGFRRTS